MLLWIDGVWFSVLLKMYNVLYILQWWLDRRSEELLGEKTARCLCEEEETLRLQQQEDERLALALSQEFIQHKLVSWDVGWGGRWWSYLQVTIPDHPKFNSYIMNKRHNTSFTQFTCLCQFMIWLLNFVECCPHCSVLLLYCKWQEAGEGPGNVEYLNLLTVLGYRVGQGFVSRNASRNTRGCVQGEVLLVPLISCSNKATWNCILVWREMWL